MSKHFLFGLLLVDLLILSNCGSNEMTRPSAPSVDMAVPYVTPFPPNPPQVARGADIVLSKPKVVPIFFQNDSMQNSLSTFIQNYLNSQTAWQTIQEYGVGLATLAKSAILNQQLPATMTDGDIRNLLIAGVQTGSPPLLPKPDANTMYLLFFPTSVTITRGTAISCQTFAGYHETLKFPDNTQSAYAVIPRCSGETLAGLTAVVSHEIAEAATDPFITSYNFLSDPYGLWGFNLDGGEIGDLCQNLIDPVVNLIGVGVISRLWSNAAAAAFRNPCQPAPAGINFQSVPILNQLLPVQFGGSIHNVELVSISVGQSLLVDVRLRSDAPQPGALWTVSVLEVPLPTQMGGMGMPALSLGWQEAAHQMDVQGQDGQTLHLQIHAEATAPLGLTMFRLTSTGKLASGAQTQTLWIGGVNVTR